MIDDSKTSHTAGKASPALRPEKLLSDEAIHDFRHGLFFGVPHTKAASGTRYQQGQSGNPKGRPRKKPDLVFGDTILPARAMLLDEVDRIIQIREGETVSHISVRQAISRAQATAAMKGNVIAQRDILQRLDQAERDRATGIATEHAFWNDYALRCTAATVEARQKGVSPPEHLPHPDDIIHEPGKPVRLTGPLNEEGLARIILCCRIRDLLIMQDAFDQRAFATTKADDQDPGQDHDHGLGLGLSSGSGPGQDTGQRQNKDPGPGSALLFAILLNSALPKRFRIDDYSILMKQMRLAAMTRRVLTKTLYREWQSISVPKPRGATFPSIGTARVQLSLMFALARGSTDGSLNLRNIANRIFNNNARAIMADHDVRF